MGKIKTAEEVKQEQEASVKAFMNRMVKDLHDKGWRTGYAHYSKMPEPNEWYISIETNGQWAERMEEALAKHPKMRCVSKKDYPGHFDWAADTYIKDLSIVVVKF